VTGPGFEGEVVKGLDGLLPEGWRLDADSPAYDVVVVSPQGNVFPIEVKGGVGLLDVSTVVDFGASVEGAIARRAIQFKWRPVAGTPLKGIVVKPIIATPREVAAASSDYAEEFHIEVVGVPQVPGGEPAPDRGEAMRLLRENLAERLTELNAEIIDQDSSGSGSPAEPPEDWYRVP
jgi:hypothetical protein